MSGRVVIVGGGGFIGRHFIDAFRRHEREVVLIDTHLPRFPLRGEQFVAGDIRDERTFDGVFRANDQVLHLAAAHHDFGLTRETFFAVNAWGAEVLSAAMEAAGAANLCFLSSVAVYGYGSGHHAEKDPCEPWGHYGASKLAAEQVLERWAGRGTGRRLLIVRPSMTFGEHNFANMYGLISQIHSGRYALVGAGRNRKSIGYVGNLVDATLHLWSQSAGPVDIYNYADKPDFSSRQLETLVAAALGMRLPPLKVPYPLARLMVTPLDAYTRITGHDLGVSSDRIRKFARDETVYDCSKVFQSGFTPAWSLEDGVRRTVKWFLQEGRELPREVRRPPAWPQDSSLAASWLATTAPATSRSSSE